MSKELSEIHITPIKDDIDELSGSEDSDVIENSGIIVVDIVTENTVKESLPVKKNAWDILMASSKLQVSNSKSNGFNSLKNKSSINKPTSTTTDVSKNSSGDNVKIDNNKNEIKRNWRYQQRSTPKPSGVLGYAPGYKKIQVGSMTVPIIVDGFQYAAKELSDTYFLTHFHSDHYGGITNDFDCGLIYCSPTTAGLVKLRLRVSGTRVIPLELNISHTIGIGGEDVQVVLTDANHCPGAVIILFSFKNGKKIMHTGDFRWNRQIMLNQPSIKSLVYVPKQNNDSDKENDLSLQKNLTIYLDTTYCDPTYDFPPQDTVINAVVELMKKEIKEPNTLFLFGAYSIGKERVYMAVAKELNLKVYVEKYRWKAMLCYDWTINDQAILTTNPSETNLWVVPMNHINFQQFNNILDNNKTYKKIIGFQPTGWVHPTTKKVQLSENQTLLVNSNNNQNSNKFILTPKLNKSNNNKIFSLPYSEHSSFNELVDCIQVLRPHIVIPTVNTNENKVKEQIQLLRDASGLYK
eukprot:gene16897-22386_t